MYCSILLLGACFPLVQLHSWLDYRRTQIYTRSFKSCTIRFGSLIFFSFLRPALLHLEQGWLDYLRPSFVNDARDICATECVFTNDRVGKTENCLVCLYFVGRRVRNEYKRVATWNVHILSFAHLYTPHVVSVMVAGLSRHTCRTVS